MLVTHVILAAGVITLCASAFAEDVPSRFPPGVKPLATHAPKPIVPAEAKAKHLKGAGLFVVYVRPDGTVSRVETVRSTGHAILDKASVDAFSQWRFIPGSVKKAKIPVQYTGVYPQK